MIKVLYVHLNYTKFSFSDRLFQSNHVYGDLPEYAKHSIDRSKSFFQDISVITEQDCKDEVEWLYSFCSSTYPNFAKDPFWFFTLARLFCVLDYAAKNKIEKFIHLEYDNLIYSDEGCLSSLPEGTYFTQVGPGIGSAGFMYSNSLQSTENFLGSLLRLMSMGQGFLAKELKSLHLYEMEMIDFLKNKNFCEYLPLFPEDKYFDLCEQVFDGASYGQYLGGTNNGDEEGWYGTHHHVGVKLDKKEIQIKFDKKPYLIFNGSMIPIYNLHVHNKIKIQQFL